MDPLSGIFHYSIGWLALVGELVRERLYYTMRTNGKEVCKSHVFLSFIHSFIHLSIHTADIY